jgi:hypothetical protein
MPSLSSKQSFKKLNQEKIACTLKCIGIRSYALLLSEDEAVK